MGSLFDGKYNQWGNWFLPITEAYLEPSRTSKITLLQKWRNVDNYFPKKLHLRCSTRFEISVCITSLQKDIEYERTDLQRISLIQTPIGE